MSIQKIYFYIPDDASGELGDIKPKKKVVPVKPTFTTNVLKLGQSTNVVDNRNQLTIDVPVEGYLTWYTWFHTIFMVEPGVRNALRRSAWFDVIEVDTWNRDSRNSQYNFYAVLRFKKSYTKQQIISGIINTLEANVALRGSVRITRF